MRYEIFLFWDISYLISRISYLWLGEGIKNPHPPNESGVGYSNYSIPRFHPGYGFSPSLIGTVTGAPGAAFPLAQLRSGIVSGRVTKLLHQMSPSLGIFPGPRVFITAFLYKKCSIFYTKCQYLFPAFHSKIHGIHPFSVYIIFRRFHRQSSIPSTFYVNKRLHFDTISCGFFRSRTTRPRFG